MSPTGMTLYGRLCGRTLAYAHARSGDRVAIAAYLGEDTEFDESMMAFAKTYAERNVKDHALLVDAIDLGRITARRGL